MLHVCLAGPNITAHQALLAALTADHDVTLVADQQRLAASAVLTTTDVLVLDAAGIRESLRDVLREIRACSPQLPIVLVDGGLSEEDKLDAFTSGVLDYFPAPCDVVLLAERLAVLGRIRARHVM